MAAKKKSFAILAIVALVYAGLSFQRIQELQREKADLSDRWAKVTTAARELSGLAPNYIAVGKTQAEPPNDVMTRLARTRLEVEERLAESAKTWQTELFASMQTLDLLRAQLSGLLPKSDHLKALDDQWKLRKDAYDQAAAEFAAKLERFHASKRSITGAPMALWDPT